MYYVCIIGEVYMFEIKRFEKEDIDGVIEFERSYTNP